MIVGSPAAGESGPHRPRPLHLGEGWVVVVAVAAAVGSLQARPLATGVVVGAVGLAAWSWRPLALAVAVGLSCSTLAAQALDGLAPPSTQRVHGWATLVSDPRQVDGGAVRADVRLGDRRLQAWARGRAASALRDRLAGERVHVRGTLARLAPSTAARLRWRHIAGRLTLDEVGAHQRGALHARAANGLRRTLAAGARPLGAHDRSLLAGFVLGDDREQPADLADDFRASGLTHLLAVSGQNVAFTLLLVGPLLRRLGRTGRLVATGAVLVLFGTVTRWEPSVIRAVAMAAVALGAAEAGRPTASLRTLGLAVTGLLVVDPLLVHSVGFVLSVGACLGIAALSGPIVGLLPGPHWLRLPVAVTLAAQAGVSPILVPVFGGVPVASLPANLLAAPAAGPAMVWGLGAGVLAGVLGPPFDAWLHAPTALLLGFVRTVAAVSAALPLGELGPWQVAALGAAGVLAARPPALRAPMARPIAGLLGAAVLLAPAMALRDPGAVEGHEVAHGVRLWRSGAATVVVVEEGPYEPSVLAGLRRAGVHRIDIVVLGGRQSMGVLDTLRGRHEVGHLAAPEDSGVSGAAPLRVGDRISAGRLHLEVRAVEPRIRLEGASDGDVRSHG